MKGITGNQPRSYFSIQYQHVYQFIVKQIGDENTEIRQVGEIVSMCYRILRSNVIEKTWESERRCNILSRWDWRYARNWGASFVFRPSKSNANPF